MALFSRNSLIALVVTVAIVGTVFLGVEYLNRQRVAELRAIEDQLTTDTLSLETQFALLSEAPCEDLAQGTGLSQEVGGIGDRLSRAEEQLGKTDPEVVRLKERYTLLQIRDYLLAERIERTCDINPIVVLYFYSNVPGECADCDRAGYALSYLRQTYPSLRVYSFDYHLDLAALKTLIGMEKIDARFPAFVIENKRLYGFTTLEEFEKAFPEELFKSATTTPR